MRADELFNKTQQFPLLLSRPNRFSQVRILFHYYLFYTQFLAIKLFLIILKFCRT